MGSKTSLWHRSVQYRLLETHHDSRFCKGLLNNSRVYSMLLKFIFVSRWSGPREEMEYSLACTVAVTCEWLALRRLGYLSSTYWHCRFFHVFLMPHSTGYRQVSLWLNVAVLMSPSYWKQICIKYFHLCYRVTNAAMEMEVFMQVPAHQTFSVL